MPKKLPLKPGEFYHIYNRGNNRRRIFIDEENYFFFLKLAKKHISPIAHIYAYALLPNSLPYRFSCTESSLKIWKRNTEKNKGFLKSYDFYRKPSIKMFCKIIKNGW